MRIDCPPDLPMPGIRLRQLERTDFDDWFDYLKIPEVVEHTSWAVISPDDPLPLLESYESTVPTSPRRLAMVDIHQREPRDKQAAAARSTISLLQGFH